MRASYASIPHLHKKLGYAIGYPDKHTRLAEIYQKNAKITQTIAALAELQFSQELASTKRELAPQFFGWLLPTKATTHFATTASLVRVREVLKHFIRDWSTEGAVEREVIFTPILDVLRYLSKSTSATPNSYISGSYKSLLIPGSGLSRLAYEASLLGYDTTACELSMYMNMALRFLLDETTTNMVGQHEVHPYAHWYSHQRNSWRGSLEGEAQDQGEEHSLTSFRGIKFPDVVPRLTDPQQNGNGGSLSLLEGDFLSLSKPSPSSSSGGAPGYDILTTLFFIDTSSNILSTLNHIHHLLRPGGLWINLGPLLYTSSASYPGTGGSKLELSLDEIVRVARMIGLEVVGYGEDGRKLKGRVGQGSNGEDAREGGEDEIPECFRPRTIPCEYTADKSAMMRWVYEAEFFVARKV
jgi:hypothetical protein